MLRFVAWHVCSSGYSAASDAVSLETSLRIKPHFLEPQARQASRAWREVRQRGAQACERQRAAAVCLASVFVEIQQHVESTAVFGCFHRVQCLTGSEVDVEAEIAVRF